MADQKLDTSFKIIDDALARYYIGLGYSDYRGSDGICLFLKYIIDEELNDPDLPIERELGDNCDPHDCAYSWMNNDAEFPIPSYAEIPGQQKEAFIYYILQYCYKHKKAPSDQYIRSILIPKCGGTINDTLSAPINNNNTRASTQMITNQNDTNTVATAAAIPYIDGPTVMMREPNRDLPPLKKDAVPTAPVRYTQGAATDDIDPEESDNIDYDKGAKAMPQQIDIDDEDTKETEVRRVRKTEFKPKYPARAHLNIFTSKKSTKELRDMIEEEFENDLILYYYTDISAALQINDHQMVQFTVSINGNEEKLSIINYDLHFKERNEYLYGIIVPNDDYKIQQDKWLWKLDEFLSADDILKKYKITKEELPQSSRLMPRFQRQLSEKLVIEEKLIDNTDWFNVQQIKSLQRDIKIPKITVTLSKEIWIKECKKSFENVDLPLIPIVVNKNNKHWIEWIKIIYVESQNIYAGISCKFDENNKKCSVESICLDRGDIYNKHRLVGLKQDKYSMQLKDFTTSITEIRFSDNGSKDTDKKMNTLKQQIRAQQESIVRLKESLLRAKNANKYIMNDGNDDILENGDDQKEQLICLERVDGTDNTLDNDDDECADDLGQQSGPVVGDEWLDQIVDDVIKKYDVSDFEMVPIGAKRNIYIDKQFIKSWINYVRPRFNDEAMMYYWLDYTTAIQMIQKYAKQYVNKENRTFIVAVINYELTDNSNNILYGIILCDDRKNNKYPYKLKTLMTKQQIHNKYGINCNDLPKKSGKTEQFINRLRRNIPENKIHIFFRGYSRPYFYDRYEAVVECLILHYTDLLTRTINKRDLERMHLKLQSMDQLMTRKYCFIALERLNNSNKNKNNNMLIPIVVTDKYNCCGIERVLIVHIIHEQRYVGIAFRYNEQMNVFVATTIYLDKGEIEDKHKLIGLKFDYCKHLTPFSLRKFKFISNRNSFIDDDDIQIRNNNEHYQQMQHAMVQYKKMYETEQLKNHHLEQQMQITNQMYLTQINALQQEQRIIDQQHIMNQQQQQMQQQQQQSMAAYQYGGYNQYEQKFDGYTG